MFSLEWLFRYSATNIYILLGMEMCHIIIHFTGLADSQNRYDFVYSNTENLLFYQFGTGRCARKRTCKAIWIPTRLRTQWSSLKGLAKGKW